MPGPASRHSGYTHVDSSIQSLHSPVKPSLCRQARDAQVEAEREAKRKAREAPADGPRVKRAEPVVQQVRSYPCFCVDVLVRGCA